MCSGALDIGRLLLLTAHHTPAHHLFTTSDEYPSSVVAGSLCYTAPGPRDQDAAERNGLSIGAIFPRMSAPVTGQKVTHSLPTHRRSGLAKETELSGIPCQRFRDGHALALCEDLLLLCTQSVQVLHRASIVVIGT